MSLTQRPLTQRVRTLPIRAKLTLLSVLVVISMASILYLGWYRDVSLRQMDDTRFAILSMDKQLLDLQRSQNNYVNLFATTYREEFSATFEQFVESTEDIKSRFWDLNLPIDTLEELVVLTSQYQYLFEVMAELQNKIGQEQGEGLRHDLSETIKNIEAELPNVPNESKQRISLHRQLVILQLHSQNLQLHKHVDDIGLFESTFSKLILDINRLVEHNAVRSRLIQSLNVYRLVFLEMANAASQIGLDFDHGLRAQIATTVRGSHIKLSTMANEINHAIIRQKRYINVLIGTLAGLFTLTFLLALIFLGRSISIPIRKVTNIMTRLADGDLKVEIPDQPRRDEIGDMLRALRVFKMGAIIRRRTQEELRTAHNELERRVEERTHELSEEIVERRNAETQLERAREEAESASKAKSLFLANMSHELRTPLNAIIGYSEMLQEDAIDFGYGEITSDLDRINTAGKHLLGIINEILDLSKIEAGRIDVEIEKFLIQDVIDAVTGTVHPLISANNNTLSVQYAPEIGEMKTDATRLRQILFNFLSNAAKFTDNGTITLRAQREVDATGDSIVFSVSDTGIGMNETQLGMVFDPFIQGDSSTTRKYGGTGLGLTVNREFARLMGGEVFVESTPNKGTTFSVRLPAILKINSINSAQL